MKIRMAFDIPPEANKWLKHHNGSKGTRQDWRTMVTMLLDAFLDDIQFDYDDVDEGGPSDACYAEGVRRVR